MTSFAAFRVFYVTAYGDRVNPWSNFWFDTSSNVTITEAFQWSTFDIQVFLVHVFISFAGYWLSWIACFMGLSIAGLAIPVMIASPLVFAYYVPNGDHLQGPTWFPFEQRYNTWLIHNSIEGLIIVTLGVLAGVWLFQCLSYAYKLCKKGNGILATDTDMFVRPYYNSVFLAQSLIVNRRDFQSTSNKSNPDQEVGNKVYICSTMYHETKQEMADFLCSINSVAKNASSVKAMQTYESHVFFDNGCNGIELSGFALQFLSLVEEILGKVIEKTDLFATPYGLQCKLQLDGGVWFVVHLKDNQKVKKKKRWSQVMYMNYVINHKLGEEAKERSYILTTDGDVKFTLNSINLLLDMVKRNAVIGGVCARTYPKGSGLLFWYQVFDYAVGHWLQKPAEQIFGSVLCCPGCFSIFKCSALKECLEEYSGEAESAVDFLCKDMGEDRWLTTLLVEKGYKMEYCAFSNVYTHCPDEFEEFFKQRRRWLPSTVANQILILSRTWKFRNQNDFITIFFLLYQLLLLFSTAIAPSTVILLISSAVNIFGLQNSSTFDKATSTSEAVFDINAILINTVLALICVAFGILCVKASQKTQLTTAKVLTFIFSLLMTVSLASLTSSVIIDAVEGLKSPKSGSSASGYGPPTVNSSTIQSQDPESPFSQTTMYVVLLTVIFFVTAFLHFREVVYIMHSMIYFLALPGAYIFLLIYAATNLDSQSWGTREGKSKEEKTFFDHPWNSFLNTLLWLRELSCQLCEVLCQEKDSEIPLQELGNIESGVSKKDQDQDDESTPMSSCMDQGLKDYLYEKLQPEFDEDEEKFKVCCIKNITINCIINESCFFLRR